MSTQQTTTETYCRGTITRELTVWCGCAAWHQGTAKGGIKEARRLGWRFTRAQGWMCPYCVATRGKDD